MRFRLTDRTTPILALVATLATVVAWVLAGPRMAKAVLSGGVLAMANYAALRLIVRRVFFGGPGSIGFVVPLVLFKLGAIAALCGALILRVGISPLGLLIGITACVVGLFAGSIREFGAANAAYEEG